MMLGFNIQDAKCAPNNNELAYQEKIVDRIGCMLDGFAVGIKQPGASAGIEATPDDKKIFTDTFLSLVSYDKITNAQKELYQTFKSAIESKISTKRCDHEVENINTAVQQLQLSEKQNTSLLKTPSYELLKSLVQNEAQLKSLFETAKKYASQIKQDINSKKTHDFLTPPVTPASTLVKDPFDQPKTFKPQRTTSDVGTQTTSLVGSRQSRKRPLAETSTQESFLAARTKMVKKKKQPTSESFMNSLLNKNSEVLNKNPEGLQKFFLPVTQPNTTVTSANTTMGFNFTTAGTRPSFMPRSGSPSK